MMSEFTGQCKRNPPVSPHTKHPYATDSLKKCLLAVIHKIKEKFGKQVQQNTPEMFPENSIAEWKKQLQDDHNRNMMQRPAIGMVSVAITPFDNVGYLFNILPLACNALACILANRIYCLAFPSTSCGGSYPMCINSCWISLDRLWNATLDKT